MGDILALLIFLSTPIALSAVLGMVLFCASRWFLEKGGWIAHIALMLVLAALGAGLIYGSLRLTGLLRFPTDNGYSYHLFDTTWRDEGFALLWKCSGPFAGVAWAIADRRKQGNGKEERNDGKQSN